MSVAYLDASAFCKLLTAEPESIALARALSNEHTWVASELLVVEAKRVALRLGGDAPARARDELERVALVPFTDVVRAAAGKLEPAALRALDAIHIATALELRD